MSLSVGDVVIVSVNEEEEKRIGVIEFVGKINNNDVKPIVGVNLVEAIEGGHKGSRKNISYFKAPHGHGIFIQISNIITKLTAAEVSLHMQQMATLFKKRLNEYISALSERDDYIQDLKSTVLRLKKRLKNQNNQNYVFHTLKELAATPPSLNKTNASTIRQKLQINPNKEYTKYSSSKNTKREKSLLSDSTTEWSDDSSSESASDTDNDNNSIFESHSVVSARNGVEHGQKAKKLRIVHDEHEPEPQIFIHNVSQPISPYQLTPPTAPVESQSRGYYKNMQQFYDMTQRQPQNIQHTTATTPQHQKHPIQENRLYPRPRLTKRRSNSVDIGQCNRYKTTQYRDHDQVHGVTSWDDWNQHKQQQQQTYTQAHNCTNLKIQVIR